MGITIISSTLASNKALQPISTTLFQRNQNEGFPSRCCSGCHSLRFRCAAEGRKVLGWSLEGRLEEWSRGEVHGRPIRVHFDLQRSRDPGPGRRQQQQPNRWSCGRQGLL